MIRTIIRALFWLTVILFAWYAASAVAAKHPEGPLLGVTAGILLALLATALTRRQHSL